MRGEVLRGEAVPAPASPCIRICIMDDATGLCIGCGRSLDEIAGWLTLSSAQREAIMQVLPARLVALAQAQGVA